MLQIHYRCVLTIACTKGPGMSTHGSWPMHPSIWNCHSFLCYICYIATSHISIYSYLSISGLPNPPLHAG